MCSEGEIKKGAPLSLSVQRETETLDGGTHLSYVQGLGYYEFLLLNLIRVRSLRLNEKAWLGNLGLM